MYEKRGVNRAALVVMNNEPARLAMQERHPEQAGRIIAMLNKKKQSISAGSIC